MCTTSVFNTKVALSRRGYEHLANEDPRLSRPTSIDDHELFRWHSLAERAGGRKASAPASHDWTVCARLALRRLLSSTHTPGRVVDGVDGVDQCEQHPVKFRLVEVINIRLHRLFSLAC